MPFAIVSFLFQACDPDNTNDEDGRFVHPFSKGFNNISNAYTIGKEKYILTVWEFPYYYRVHTLLHISILGLIQG